MILTADYHIHSEYSYDAKNTLAQIAEEATREGLSAYGITDHLNFNDNKFLDDLRRSAAAVGAVQNLYPKMILGVELTPIERPEFDYIAANGGSRDGYLPPATDKPYDIELAMTKQELISLGVRYAVGGAHWRVDCPGAKSLPIDLEASVREWHRQQMFLAADERVTVLAHPWWHGNGIWYDDFGKIPRSMNNELSAVLKENGKYAECNSHFFHTNAASEKFKHQYAEFLRELYEGGIRITYGSDSHANYRDLRDTVEKYLIPAGFKPGDFSRISDSDFFVSEK